MATLQQQLTVPRQDVERALPELKTLPSIAPAQMAALQSTLSCLRPTIGPQGGTSTDARSAIQALAREIETLVTKQQQNAALGALKFGKLHERFDSITIAEANTYAWLLPHADDASASAPALSEHLAAAKKTFLDWLETGSGFFYTSGKPGAGKSTLMKFICRHPQFYDCAGRWAGDATLVIGRFFFWKPGQSEQKSISGMLRGLLYSILESRPDIAAVAMPELCDSLLTDKAMAVSDEDVRNAFQNMLNAFASSKKYAVLLVLDGLDEFEGEHGDLLALMQSWVSQHPSTIKICVSSREYGIFEDFFARAPKFRLHELTKDDMALLITSRFSTSQAFAQLPGRDLPALLPLIIDRAEGVFLWVILAISSLEDGMEAGDIKTVRELQGYVKRLPSELDDFLSHVHKSVSEYNRPWAYKAITLVHFAQFRVAELLASGEGYPGVGLLDFMLLDEAASSSWNLTMFSPRSDSKTAPVEARLALVRRKVLCRPKGFLAVSNLPNVHAWPANGTEKPYMTFTHRSVVEFLESPAAVGLMASYMGSFDPFFAMASCELAALRFAPPTDYPLLKGRADLPSGDNVALSALLADSLIQRFKELIECAMALDKSGSTRFLSILDAIGDAIKRHLTLLLPMQRIRLAVEDNSPHQILVHLTLANHIFEYSEWKRKQPGQGGGKKMMSASLFHAFQAMIQRCRPATPPTVSVRELEHGRSIRVSRHPSTPSDSKTIAERLNKVLGEFFENGLDLNWSWHGAWQGTTTAAEDAWTCWQAMLWAVVIGDIPHEEKQHGDILSLLLQHGAARDVKIIAQIPQGPLEMEDLEPAEGWYLVAPFEGRAGPSDGRRVHDNASGLDAMLPTVLMHESLPIVQWAKEHDWVLTVGDLIKLTLGKDARSFGAY